MELDAFGGLRTCARVRVGACVRACVCVLDGRQRGPSQPKVGRRLCDPWPVDVVKVDSLNIASQLLALSSPNRKRNPKCFEVMPDACK